MVAGCPPLTRTAQHKATSARQGTRTRSKDHPAAPLQRPPAHRHSPAETSPCAGTDSQPCPALHSPGTTARQQRLCSRPAGTSCTQHGRAPALLSRDPRGWHQPLQQQRYKLKRTSCCAQPESRIPSHCRSRAGLQTLQLSNLRLRHQVAPCTSPAQSPEPTFRPADMLSQHMVPQQTHLGEEAPDSASSQTTCT